MKKDHTKTTGYNLTDIALRVSLIVVIALIVYCIKSCNETKNQLDEMKAYHSHKGIVEERNNLLIIRK